MWLFDCPQKNYVYLLEFPKCQKVLVKSAVASRENHQIILHPILEVAQIRVVVANYVQPIAQGLFHG